MGDDAQTHPGRHFDPVIPDGLVQLSQYLPKHISLRAFTKGTNTYCLCQLCPVTFSQV